MAQDEEETLPLSPEPDGGFGEADSRETVVGPGARPGRLGALERLGSYRLEHELGRGGQGLVYLAEDERLHRRVALKILSGVLAFSESARLRFQREAEVASRLDHRGIARIFELGEDQGLPYIAMEFVQGETLASRLARQREAGLGARFEASSPERRRQLDDVVRLIEEAALALHAAHEAGLVHRDIKPGNIMVREDGSPCILDFGLAKDESRDDQGLTLSGDLLGTPSYMSPEQLSSGAQLIDRRTDVYSLGVTLYECCLLRRPFEAASRDELFLTIRHREPPRPRQVDPTLPRDLEAIILTAIDKERDRRYPSALALADDLRRFRDGEPVRARPTGRFMRLLRVVRRNPLPASLVTAVILALALAATTFYLKGQEALRAQNRAQRETRAKSAALAASLRERAAKEAALLDYRRLSDVSLLDQAIAEADALLPIRPEIVLATEAWLERYQGLADRLPEHEALLEELRRQAAPYDESQHHRDHSELLEEIADLKRKRELIAQGSYRPASVTTRGRDAVLAEYDQRISAFEAEAGQRLSWSFPGHEDLQFRHDVMARHVERVREFAGTGGLLSDMRVRLDLARRIGLETVDGKPETWAATRERIARSPLYTGLEIRPQIGLVPLGPDPASGLEEFLLWLSHEGPLPTRGPDGRFAPGENCGVIMVLLPGGRFWMGAQAIDPATPGFEEAARSDEDPVNEVELAPFFIAKYELSQGQFGRATGDNPSTYRAGLYDAVVMRAAIDYRHPVENLSWIEAQMAARRLGVELVTEAQWEYAARAGTGQSWPGCSDHARLSAFANLGGAELAPLARSEETSLRDDWVLHAPIGSFEPNQWGLHDMAGNVWEWCLDVVEDYRLPAQPPRGLRSPTIVRTLHIIRGGSFIATSDSARCAQRDRDAAEYRAYDVGTRLARPLEP
ncbi:MAG: SUMF1/EgtB/PvdO family nonheme iron enzyme [Planctomycetes bacterium]|nr:SUMF1/EgtB/PvdO family nonheme iron enzyme [Planctomycetota bacterium]